MKRISKKIHLEHPTQFKTSLINWMQQFEVFSWMDSNNYSQKYTSYELILAVDAYTYIDCNYKNAFIKLNTFKNFCKDYIFGYLGYDLKNDLELLNSKNIDLLGFSDLYFFQPKKIFFIKGNTLEVQYLSEFENEIESDLAEINGHKEIKIPKQGDFQIQQKFSKNKYSNKLRTILNHIHRGDIYEVNFCQEFYAQNATINPLEVYQKLNAISGAPFATFLKIKDKFLLSASPERFVKKEDTKIISQPIKGTARRLANNKADQELANQLFNDPKERTENIMIVDLVRNDLSKTALKGSVQVEKLCNVQTFKQVHQLISTVVSKVDTNKGSVDIIKTLFPMGSMTGAPKISAMKIIEEQEETKRGLYSGAVGYFTPDNDFDFNVVIRSILYNQTKKHVSFTVGGAITSKSNIDKEYEECMIKAAAMKKALTA
ncbi:MAG: anthranilate synthase component I family protein [Flavobacteriaceae bacterium]|nr:anthranilate synthase component I family protein [Flavobacteriaceae bacterium]